MQPRAEFDPGYLIAILAGVVALCWVAIFGAGDDDDIPHDDWDEFEPKPKPDPEDVARLTVF